MDEPTGEHGRLASWLEWLLPAVVLTAALHLVASFAPARIRLLGLFGIAVGLLTGAALGGFVRLTGRPSGMVRQKPPLPLLLAVFVLVVGGQLLAGYVSHRRYAADVDAQAAKQPPLESLLMGELESADDGESLARQEELRSAVADQVASAREEELRRRKSFSAWLRYRISNLPDWTQPAALWLWAAEVLLAGLAGACAAVYVLKTESDAGPDETAPPSEDGNDSAPPEADE